MIKKTILGFNIPIIRKEHANNIKCFFGWHEHVEARVIKGGFFGLDWQAADECRNCGSMLLGYYGGKKREASKENTEFVGILLGFKDILRRKNNG